MTKRTTRVVLGAGLFAVLLAIAPAAGQGQEVSPTGVWSRAVEPRADAILKAMGERLAGLERFAFEAEETFDEIPDREPRTQLSNLRRVAVKPVLSLQLTDIDEGGKVVALATDAQTYTAKGKKPAKMAVGGAALGAGIGAIVNGGEGAAWGAGIGAVAGTAGGSKGNQVAVGAGTALEFHLAQPLSVNVLTQVAAAGP